MFYHKKSGRKESKKKSQKKRCNKNQKMLFSAATSLALRLLPHTRTIVDCLASAAPFYGLH
jgi:hypothetical protein